MFPESWRFVLVHKGGKNPICLSDAPEGWAASAEPWSVVQGSIGKTVRGYSAKRQREGRNPWYRTEVGAIGCLAGVPSGGLLFVDCDGEQAEALLRSWGELPKTWAVRSGRPGRQQFVFWVDKAFWSAIETTKFAAGPGEQLELRWSGTQSIVYGKHPTGSPYQWFDTDCEIAEAPFWIVEKMLKTEKPSAGRASWAEFERGFSLPCQQTLPLLVLLRREDRELIASGAGAGSRNDAAFKLAANLIGTANYLDLIGQPYSGSPEQLYQQFAQACAGGGGWNEREWMSVWRSAQKGSPGPALTPGAMEASARSWVWKHCTQEYNVEQPTKREQPAPAPKGGNDAGEQETRKHKLVQDYELIQATFGDRLKYNTLKNVVELDGEPLEIELSKHLFVIEHGLWLNSGKEDVSDIVMLLAKKHKYNPIEQYLERCYAQFGDDIEILNRFAERYFGQSDPIYTIMVARFLVGSVARIFEPGCKHDNALILQGGQGIRKSTFFKVLASEPWFDDSLGGISDKDEKLKLHQTWFMEWAELETIFKRKDLSATKAFLSSATDRIRPPYGRSVIEMPRRCSIVGTTNQDEFLNDVTGNRRFWVIPVKVKSIDTERLAVERDRIWAAAVALYKRGEFWHLMSCEDQAAGAVAEQFQSEDPWLQPIKQWLDNSSGTVTTSSILLNALQIDTGRQDKAAQMRVTDILKTLGWENTRKYVDGSRQRFWTRNGTTRTTLNQEVVPYINLEESTLRALFEDHGTTRTTGTTYLEKTQKMENDLPSEVDQKSVEILLGDSAVPVVPVVPSPTGQGFETGQPPRTRLSQAPKQVVPSRQNTPNGVQPQPESEPEQKKVVPLGGITVGSRVFDLASQSEAIVTDLRIDQDGHPVCFLNGHLNEIRFVESVRLISLPEDDTLM